VPLVVDVEAVIDGMILEVGNEAGHIDDGHSELLVDSWLPPACHYGELRGDPDTR
jgi:hypothetical protein